MHPTQPRQAWNPPVPRGDNESRGNIIFSYYNMGHVQKGTSQGQHVAALVRRQPSFVFACSEATEDLLQMIQGPSDAAITANQDLSDKKESQYKCVLQEHVGKKNMIGVRTTCASDLDTLKQGAIDHGVNGTRNSVSTYLICKFKLLNEVACLPPEIVIMCFHYHYLAAKKGTESPDKKDALRQVVQLVRRYNVTFLMMDANMAFSTS